MFGLGEARYIVASPGGRVDVSGRKLILRVSVDFYPCIHTRVLVVPVSRRACTVFRVGALASSEAV